MAAMRDIPPVACLRCAAAAAHPFAELPASCPNCGRDRDRT